MAKEVYETYLKRVSQALERTGHSRRGEVLDDLREHLTEFAAQSEESVTLDSLIQTLGSPEEYAENLATPGSLIAKPWFRSRAFWTLSIMAVLFLVAAGLVWQRHTIAAHYREIGHRNFTANPFFDLTKARAIKAGASASEIREAIGFPLKRYTGYLKSELANMDRAPGDAPFALTASKDEIVWEYTASPDPKSPFYTVCNVITDRDMKFVRVDVTRNYVPLAEQFTFFRAPLSHAAGDVTLMRGESEAKTLGREDSDVYVLLSTIVQGDLVEHCRLEREKLANSLGSLSLDRVHVVNTPVATDEPPLEARLDGLPDGEPIYSGLRMAVSGWIAAKGIVHGYGHVYFYHRGVLYESPEPYTGSDSALKAARTDDVRWLLEKLLSGGT